MKFGMVNKSTTVNRFVLHTSHRNITHLAIIRRKTNIKLGILKGGGELEKSQKFVQENDVKIPRKFVRECFSRDVFFLQDFLYHLKTIDVMNSKIKSYFTCDFFPKRDEGLKIAPMEQITCDISFVINAKAAI